MNRAAPTVNRGNLDPAGLGYEEAVALMIQDPILIRRPLEALHTHDLRKAQRSYALQAETAALAKDTK